MVKSVGGIDRISNLPDPLLSHILSLLPTKCAVATGVLSTRWKFLWTSITNIDFESDEAGYYLENELEMKRNKFTHFVNKVLLQLDPPSVQKFYLKCCDRCFDPSYLNAWIRVAFGRTVRQLALVLMLEEYLELPLSHICYSNVAILKLEGDIRFNIPAATSVCFPNLQALHLHAVTLVMSRNSSVSFPNLKRLHLEYVTYANEDSVHKLFSSCPVLDDLIIERDTWDNIDTPALQYLYLDDDLPCDYLPVVNLPSLLQAKVKVNISDEDVVDVGSCISISKFIGSLYKVKFLSVLGRALTAIRIASANISSGFHNLSRLELEEQDCLDFSVVVNSLESMNNLEHLVLKGGTRYSCSHQSWWTEPLNVPNCLLSRVTTFSFTDLIVGCSDQLELVRYLLKNAKVLQLLTIKPRSIFEFKRLELLQKISMFPRGSQTCQVPFN